MKLAVFAFTKKGMILAQHLQQHFGATGYFPRRLAFGKEGFWSIEGKFVEFVGEIFRHYQGLIFVSAVGIAVRGVAPHLKSKWCDPAVVVVDEAGRFVVSLLSGHWGGGNRLAQEVAKVLGATPVITTASDLSGMRTPEILARDFQMVVEEEKNLPQINALLLEGGPVVYVSDEEEIKERFPAVMQLASQIPLEAQGVVFITDKRVEKPPLPFVVLRPRKLVLGVGMRRGMVFPILLELVRDFLDTQGMALSGVGEIASVEQKRDEPALQELARYLGVPTRFFSVEELQKVAPLFPASLQVKQVLGVGSVARPSAFLGSGGGIELGFFRGKGVTLSLFRRKDNHVD